MGLTSWKSNATTSRQEEQQQTDQIDQRKVTEKDKNKFDIDFFLLKI